MFYPLEMLNSLKSTFFLIGIALVVLIWILDLFVDVILLQEGTFYQHLTAPSPHDIFERLIISALIIIFSFMGSVLLNRSRQAEKEIRQSQERLRQLAAQLQMVREEEQTRISREIHDELGQTLTGLRLDLAWILEKMPKHNKALTVRAQAALLLVDEMLETIQSISHSLRPSMLDELGLEAAIEWQVLEFSRHTGCRNKMELMTKEIGIDNTRDTVVFRVLQESLTNVARHAQADQVEVSLSALDAQLVLRVEDNGIGIDNEEKISSEDAFGILGMHERCEAIGGKFQIEAIKGGGTWVICTVPLSGTA